MGYQHSEGWGSVFKNRDKQPGDNRPALTGDGMYQGQMVKLAVWKKKTKGDEVYFSIYMEPKEAQQAPPPEPTPPRQPPAGFDDDIPF